MKRGRTSAASLAVKVDGKPSRLSPPSFLDANERQVFADLVASCDPSHFRPSDLPLLARYAESVVLAQQAAKELRSGAVVNGRPSAWLAVQEKTIRAIVALSMRLRLSPQSRIDPKTTGRQTPTGKRPWSQE